MLNNCWERVRRSMTAGKEARRVPICLFILLLITRHTISRNMMAK
uniref:Uncharacterized protein n=1 Tax=Arundo donax TaxID=35708 RepID=A0A0A8ZRU8_ARUDO